MAIPRSKAVLLVWGTALFLGDTPTTAQAPVARAPVWTEIASGAGVPDMYGGGMAYDASRDRVVFYGGYTCKFPSGQTWEWDGSRWQQAFPTASPSPTRDTVWSMAYDSHYKRCIIFGGSYGARTLNDTWEYDGTTWKDIATDVRPPARYGHMLAYDEERRCVVLFGGRNAGSTYFDDTWTFDGTAWKEQHPKTHPSARVVSGITYDPIRKRVVMFGGGTAVINQRVVDETWEWDGTDWLLRQPIVRPKARSGAAFAYDYQRRQAVLFGGGDFFILPLADTWAWDGQQWTQITASGPTARRLQAMVYDSRRGYLVMGGGVVDGMFSSYCFDDTWLLPSPTPGFAGFGTPCPGSTTPVLSLQSTVPSTQGGSLSLRLSNLPGSAVAVLALGSSRQQWNGQSLPWTLSLLGAPSCSLWVSPDVLVPATVSGTFADLTVPIPASTGYEIHTQGVVLDATTPSGFALSTAATIAWPVP